jgi:glycerol kinase
MRTCVIDAGSTSVRAVVYEDRRMLDFDSLPLERKNPRPGYVELDPKEIFGKAKTLLDSAIDKWKVDAIAITNQRTTSVLWDVKTKENIFPSLTWQDIRAKPIADALNSLGILKVGKVLGRLTSLIYPIAKESRRVNYLVTVSKLSFKPNHASVHLMWMLQNLRDFNVERLRFGTIDSWLLYNLCGEHSTDFTNASATGIYDIFYEKWSENILRIIGFPEENLPEIKPSDSVFGEYRGIPICSIVADQQASLFAQACFEEGEIKCTNGTGSFVDLNVGEKPKASLGGLIPMVGVGIRRMRRYILEGYVSFTGSSIEWLKDIGILKTPEESEKLALRSGDENVLIVPSFTGLGTPHYSEISAMFYGITNRTKKEDIVRSMLEAIAFRIGEIVALMREVGVKEQIRVDGKLSSNSFLVQRIADVTGLRIARSRFLEGSSFGAHLIAGLAMEQWKVKEIEFLVEREFRREEDLSGKFSRWLQLVRKTKEIGM